MPMTVEHHRYRAILPRVRIKGKAHASAPASAARYHRDSARPGRRAPRKIYWFLARLAEIGIARAPDRRFQGDRSLGYIQDFAHFSSGIANLSASSSGLASRPISVKIWSEVRTSRLIVSISCSGTRIMRSPTSSRSGISLSPKADVAAELARSSNDVLPPATQAEVRIGANPSPTTTR
jgi:hypothetical protein